MTPNIRTHRGIGRGVLYNDYKVHQTASWCCFSSASLNPDVAVKFTKGRPGTIFIINSEQCKRIRVLSLFPGEDEVVFSTNSRFHVVGHLPTTHLRLIEQPCRVILMLERTHNTDEITVCSFSCVFKFSAKLWGMNDGGDEEEEEPDGMNDGDVMMMMEVRPQ